MSIAAANQGMLAHQAQPPVNPFQNAQEQHAPETKEPESKEEAPEEIEPEVDEETARKNAIYDYIESLDGPSREEIERMKGQYGSVHLLPLDNESIFLYRALKRSEWNALKTVFMNSEGMDVDKQQQIIVEKCLIFPQIATHEWAVIEAGLTESLYHAISASSYFLSPEAIQNMVMKL